MPSDASFVQAVSYAENFERYRNILKRLLNHDPEIFDLPKDAAIADLGCGFGDLLLLLKQRGYTKLTGVEPDAVCRRGAAANGLTVSEGTIANTGLSDAACDAAIVNCVFHHIDNYAAACEEIARVLVPHGLLCFIEPAPTMLRKAMDFLTFQVPLRKIVAPVQSRYDVMILEMETGLYPKWLRDQAEFASALHTRFDRVWHKTGWLFQFGKYRRR